jgi:A/G-specific adenine glycosylase
LLIQKRSANDIWRGLYQFPLIETKSSRDPKQLLRSSRCLKFLGRVLLTQPTMTGFKQILTHQVIYGRFIEVKGTRVPEGFALVDPHDLNKFAFPRLLTLFLEKSKLL